MRKGRKSLVLLLAIMTLLLTSCQAPAASTSAGPSTPIETPPVEPEYSFSPLEPAGVEYLNYGPYYTHLVDANTFGDPTFVEETIVSDQETLQQELESFYDICYNLPAALASCASAFPSITVGTHLNTNDPIEITSQLCKRFDNGEIQQKILEELRDLVDSSGTDVELVHARGLVRMTQAYIITGIGADEQALLEWTQPFHVDAITLLKITRHFADGSKEIGYFSIYDNYCLVYPADGDLVG